MIIETLFGLIKGIINLIPFNLPASPEQVGTVLDFIFNGIISSLGIVNLFIDLKFWITCAVIITVVYNIKHIWNTFVFILNLIPGVSISFWN